MEKPSNVVSLYELSICLTTQHSAGHCGSSLCKVDTV